MPYQHWAAPVLASLSAASLCLGGCGELSAPQETVISRDSESSAPGTAHVDSQVAGRRASEIPLEIKSWEEVQDWVSSQPQKLVVIDVWSTYCLPCLREFPHFVDLHESYGDQIACASLSVDFYGGSGDKPEAVRPQVLKFLDSQNASMQNFISSDPDETVLKQIDAATIPVTLVYNQDGKLKKVFSNDDGQYGPDGYSYEKDVTPYIERLLKPAQENG